MTILQQPRPTVFVICTLLLSLAPTGSQAGGLSLKLGNYNNIDGNKKKSGPVTIYNLSKFIRSNQNRSREGRWC